MAKQPAVLSNSFDWDRRLFSVISRLARETGSAHLGSYLAAFALTAIVAGTTAAMAFLLEDVVNEIFVERDLSAIFLLAGVVFGIFVVRGFASFGYGVILSRVANAIVLEVKVRCYKHLMSKEPSFFARSSSGELMTLINAGSKGASGLLNTIAVGMGRDFLTVIALIGVLLVQDTELALGVIVAVPIFALIVSQATKRLRTLSRKTLQLSAALNNRIRASIQGVRVAKAFGIEAELEKAMQRNAADVRSVANKQAIVSNRVTPFTEIVGGTAVAGCIAFGGWRLSGTDEPPGALISFIVAALMVYDPARRLSQARASIEKHLVGVRIMYDFLDTPKAVEDQKATRPLEVQTGEVRFEDVVFEYDEDHPALHGVSFTAEAGKMTAVVGPSGAGKSTIASLLLRFWRVQGGKILIDGTDISDVRIEMLREAISYVGQEPFLFDGTIRENILVGRRAASSEEVIEAATAAGAHEFISALPDGYDSLVGELGSNLSGGQRQRIAIARAFVRDSKLLILDEPTSALDTETERRIQMSLQNLMRGRTTIMIAHRLSTIRDADRIVVLEAGRVVETGTHAALISAGNAYARLYGNGATDRAEYAQIAATS